MTRRYHKRVASDTLKARFESKVFKTGGHHFWTGCTDGKYGKIYCDVTGREEKAHRVAAYLYLGFDLTSPLRVLHKCDVEPCVDPDHLFIGTQGDNLVDAYRKGRKLPPPGRPRKD